MNDSILQQLKDKGFKASLIAKELGVNRSAVYQAKNGTCSRRIRLKIAKELGMKPSEIWIDNDVESLRIDDAVYQIEVERS
jgi:lambda repressor-like predicted transcriptional regulator